MGSFPAALPKLQASLPQWLAAGDPTSEMFKTLAAAAAQQDELGATFDSVSDGRSLLTCSQEDLYEQYAYVYGLQNEQAAPTPQALRTLLIAMAAADATVNGTLNVLIALLSTPQNVAGGTVLLFDAGGAGLTFPADGSGLTTYQFVVGQSFLPQVGLQFNADGTGVLFPPPADGATLDTVIPADGSGVVLSSPAPLYFQQFGLVAIIPDPDDATYEVRVGSYLQFDRPTFARLVNRLRPSHLYAPTIKEV